MKEVRINFSSGKGNEFKYLVRFYVDCKLVNWKEVSGSQEIGALIAEFYFPSNS